MKKKKIKEKFNNIIKSYKIIIITSLLVNIVLLSIICYILHSNKLYTFSGSDNYIEVKDGILSLNTDINIINNNNVKYISNTDYDIKSYKIGYYVMENNKLIEIISNNLELNSEIKLSELINNFASFNVSEKNNENNYFTYKKKKLLPDGLYLVIEAKTTSGEDILSKVKLNVTKISKY